MPAGKTCRRGSMRAWRHRTRSRSRLHSMPRAGALRNGRTTTARRSWPKSSAAWARQGPARNASGYATTCTPGRRQPRVTAHWTRSMPRPRTPSTPRPSHRWYPRAYNPPARSSTTSPRSGMHGSRSGSAPCTKPKLAPPTCSAKPVQCWWPSVPNGSPHATWRVTTRPCARFTRRCKGHDARR